ncbi:unnamed protein product [Scytosiphon promiscuus]
MGKVSVLINSKCLDFCISFSWGSAPDVYVTRTRRVPASPTAVFPDQQQSVGRGNTSRGQFLHRRPAWDVARPRQVSTHVYLHMFFALLFDQHDLKLLATCTRHVFKLAWQRDALPRFAGRLDPKNVISRHPL